MCDRVLVQQIPFSHESVALALSKMLPASQISGACSAGLTDRFGCGVFTTAGSIAIPEPQAPASVPVDSGVYESCGDKLLH
jgi:hypothetical protein